MQFNFNGYNCSVMTWTGEQFCKDNFYKSKVLKTTPC